ncbi:AGAP009256-PE-like protein [Anopheles sinensis]|uniref:AGAP009256-PE-like protein n=1 Tax=Anopheles sinensis TaxID=74873 RepID=A0A084WH18_ANOSI|nr:AGAP009256-PE-like protein [Anopheles sinensis]
MWLFLFKVLYIKGVLLGVIPFRFQLYPASLECRSILLYYCYLVAIVGQGVRFLMNFFWAWNYASEFFVLRVASIFNYCLESVTLALPVFYVLSYRKEMIVYFNYLKQLYYSPLLIGRIRLEKWLWKCIHFNLLYDIVYFTTMMAYGILSSDSPPNTMVAYVLCMYLTTFSKATVLLIMYGVGQYLLNVWKSMNAVLLPSGQTSTQYGWNELMLLYDQLWKCCECFKALFGIPIMCYLLLEFIHSTVILYTLSSIFLLGKANLTPIEIVLAVEELSWAVFDLLYVMVIIGTCSQIKDEVLYIKGVLLGVIPFRFQLYPASLECRSILLCYCYFVTIIGQSVRFLMNFFWAWNYAPEFFVLRAASIFNYVLESVVLALPVFYVLLYRNEVIVFFNYLKKLYFCPLLTRRVRPERWLWKCIRFNLLYNIVYIGTMIVYFIFSSDFPPKTMVVYVLCMYITTFSKATVLLIMYGAGQYLLIVWNTMNNILLLTGQASTQCVWNELMLLYDQLWKCCKCFNALFGIPIMCYLLLEIIHSTVTLYTVSSVFLLGKANLTLTELLLSAEELSWAVFDLLCVMVIVGTCSQIKDEDARLFMNFVWAWNYSPEYVVLRATSIFNYFSESVVLALPVLYILSYRKKVLGFFNCLKQLYYSSLLTGRVQLEKWRWNCIHYNLFYDVMYIITMVSYGILSSDFPPEVMVAYVPFLCFTTLSKVIVLLIMYGSGQYLLIVWKSMNSVLLSGGQTSSLCVWDEFMLLYDQLWKCCECFKALFGIPIMCYLFLVFLHTTVTLYTLSSMFLLGKANLTPIEIVVSYGELFWIGFDLLYIMLIVGTCSLVKDEYNY